MAQRHRRRFLRNMLIAALLALVISYVTLYKTRFGLRLMACGEHPQAANSVGINVYKMRWAGVLISGVLGREKKYLRLFPSYDTNICVTGRNIYRSTKSGREGL